MYVEFLPVTGVLAATAILAVVAEPLHGQSRSYAGIGSTRDLPRRQPQWNRETCHRTNLYRIGYKRGVSA